MAFFTRLVRIGGAWTTAALLCSSCTVPASTSPTMTPTFSAKPPGEEASAGPLLAPGPPAEPREQIAPGPVPPAASAEASTFKPTSAPTLKGVAETLNLEQVNLATFVNEVFSRALKLTVHTDQRVMGRTDLVTLSTGKPLPAEDLFQMATKILSSYGISAAWDGSVLNIVPNDALMSQMPDIIRSRALPELPIAMRPIFQVVDLEQTSATDMSTLLSNVYGSKVRIFPSAKANALLLFGLPEDVRGAVAAVHVLDQGRLAGRLSLRVNPVYWSASKLADQLVTLLKGEGYDAATSAASQAAAIMVIPVEANNSVIVLARDPKLLAHAKDWITELDQPASVDPQSNIFVYSVRNTTAAILGKTVIGVLGAAPSAAAPPTGARLEQAGATRGGQNAQSALMGALTPQTPQTPGTQSSGGSFPGRSAGAARGGQGAGEETSSATTLPSGTRVIVDSVNNALIIVGTAQEYERIRPLLTKLDVPPLEVLIEVTVAELDLTNSTSLGVEWRSQ